jgi:phenylacetate-coenzyme A ligase PaaK-like adenylate-forming protein
MLVRTMPGSKTSLSPRGLTASSYEERCRHALDAALCDTPMYEGWGRFDPGAGHAIDERFAALPALTKDDIRAHFPDGLVPRGRHLADALARGEVSFVTTSGTADEAVQNIWNQRWWDASERASWALNAVAARVATGTHPEAILASALSVGPRAGGAPLPREARRLGRFLFLNEYGRTDEWPRDHERRILGEIAEYRPSVLEANPSLLARVSRWALRNGVRPWQPPLITLTYELPSALQRAAIGRVFGSPVASSYGSTEAGYVFMECGHHRLHQNTESCRVDLVPVAGECRGAPAPGALGRLLVTTFGNEWFPLLRFEIGDVGRRAVGPCPCGRGEGLTLEAIEGRLKSLCVAGDGRLLTHGEIDRALSAVEGIEQYRVDQDAFHHVSCALVAEPGGSAPAARAVSGARDALDALFGARVSVDVHLVPGLVPEKSGKFLHVHRSFALEEAPRG